jgi:hypothetical protein
MITYTTPSLTLEVKGVDISSCNIYVSFKQSGIKKIVKKGSDLNVRTETEDTNTNTFISFILTQEETGKLSYNSDVFVMVNWIDQNGIRRATDEQRINVDRNQIEEVIEYEG